MNTETRITRFAEQGDGSRSFGLEINGLRVLVTAGEGRHADGFALAELIAQLGPEAQPVTYRASPAPTQRPTAPRRHEFTVGQRVWCTVRGVGHCTITEVGEGRNRGRVKIAGERCWCPAHNFVAERPEP